MTREAAATYLDLAVGIYELALSSQWVAGVHAGLRPGDTLRIRDTDATITDLMSLFGGPTRRTIPYVIACDTPRGVAALGVDRVGNLRQQERRPITALPLLGISQPQLFAGAIRENGRVLFVLRPDQWVKMLSQ